MKAICTADPSHEIKVDKWEGDVAYEIKVNRWVMNIPVVCEANAIDICPICGAPIKVVETCPYNKQCWGTVPQCNDDYKDCPIYKGKTEEEK